MATACDEVIMRKMKWTRGRMNNRLTERRRELITQERWCMS